MCRLSKVKQYHDQESLLTVQHQRISESTTKNHVFYQVRFTKNIQSDQNENKRKMKNSFSHTI